MIGFFPVRFGTTRRHVCRISSTTYQVQHFLKVVIIYCFVDDAADFDEMIYSKEEMSLMLEILPRWISMWMKQG
jgi:hypothetical protein